MLTRFSKLKRITLLTAMLSMLCALNLRGSGQGVASRSAARSSVSRVTPTAINQPTLVQRYQQLIAPASLASRLYFLASDFFEGRETTTRGQKLAAFYLASQYRALGLTPKGTVKSNDPLSPLAYLQRFPLYRLTPKASQLEVLSGDSRVASSSFSAETHDDLSYFRYGNRVPASGGVVFAGYGIADDKLGYNDYAALAAQGISIDGKWVMMLADEPLADAKTSLLPTADHQLSNWTTKLRKKIAVLAAGKPAGILEVRLASPLVTNTFDEQSAAASRNAQRIGALSINESPDFPPTYAISGKMADQILASSGRKIEELRSEINRSLKPAVFEASGVTVRTTVEASPALEAENVLAFIEGSDPKLKDEVVVISAHYDHLGLNPALTGDQIFNGAADDGSGVVACLELAQTFMAAKREGSGPRRSILFINFAGEEKGLLGSSYYTDKEPLVPLEKIVADISMDGVGGIDLQHPSHSKNYIYIIGDKSLSTELIEINQRVKTAMGSSIELTDGNGKGFNSDDSSFRLQLVPFIYYSTGRTEFYHQPGDEPNTIDYEHLAGVTRLIFATAWQVANQDARPSGVNRSQLTSAGYICPPCPYECDDVVYAHPGACPICGMNLIPKYSMEKKR